MGKQLCLNGAALSMKEIIIDNNDTHRYAYLGNTVVHAHTHTHTHTPTKSTMLLAMLR